MSQPVSSAREKQAAAIELRRLIRFSLHAGCVFWWHSEELGTMFGEGQTVDLSSGGVCVRSSHTMHPGQLLSIEVTLPAGSAQRDDAETHTRHRLLTLRGEGYVIWSDTTRQMFAAQVCFASLETLPGADSEWEGNCTWLPS